MTGDVDRHEIRPARGYSWPPFEPGNQANRKHGMRAMPREEDHAEIEELRQAYRAALGHRHEPALDPLVDLAAALAWRLRRGYADLSQHGITRSTGAAPVLRHIEAAERSLVTVLDKLALTVPAMAETGLTLARLNVEQARLDRLSPARRQLLAELLDEITDDPEEC